jgi:hypothetical protein
MNLEDRIRKVLFNMGKEIKILKIDDDNMIFSIDYETYVQELKLILGEYKDTPDNSNRL